MSPSMRREWIEMFKTFNVTHLSMSPSMRREWIEIASMFVLDCTLDESPSMRREWIEIGYLLAIVIQTLVSLHAEGVD